MAPDGFYILNARRDGEDICMDRYNVDMEPEGDYVIEYECTPTNMIYKLRSRQLRDDRHRRRREPRGV